MSKKRDFNNYLEDCIYIFYLSILSLIPWIEFINENLNEVDFILNKNFYFILSLYLGALILIYFLIRFMSNHQRSHIICTISLSTWILFQHRFLTGELKFILTKINFGNFSSELALFIIILSFFFIFFVISKNFFLVIFFYIFLILNLCFSGFFLISSLYAKKNYQIETEISEKSDKENLLISKKSPNIYFFILDAMMPLNEFENFYNLDLKDFKNKYEKNNYIYFMDTKNLYGDTIYSLTALFFLESIFIEDGNFDEITNLKPNIYKKFPSLLAKKYKPKLISELKDLGYEFKWIGNIFADCSSYNYNLCLQNTKKVKLDYYLLGAFLKKTPLPQIYNIILSPDFIQKKLGIYQENNAINKLQKYLLFNSDELKKTPTFYFTHHMHPHWPYKFDKDCNFKNYTGNLNFEGYKNSYLCVTKQILDIIDVIEKVDNKAIVIFQSDHSWEMSKISKEKYGDRLSIFSLIKNNVKCSKPFKPGLNNIEITKFLLNCLKEKR